MQRKGFAGRSAPRGSVKGAERSVGLRGEREENNIGAARR